MMALRPSRGTMFLRDCGRLFLYSKLRVLGKPPMDVVTFVSVRSFAIVRESSRENYDRQRDSDRIQPFVVALPSELSPGTHHLLLGLSVLSKMD
jgi:hypothetical protein